MPAQTIRSDPTKASRSRQRAYSNATTHQHCGGTQRSGTRKARSGIRSTTLVVRMVSTVDNYDYLTEMEFVPDGFIRVDLVLQDTVKCVGSIVV